MMDWSSNLKTEPPSRAQTRQATAERTLSTAFAAILAITVFRLVTLVESPINLQFDEAQYWDWSRHLAFGYVSKPPLIAWLIRATTALFGDSEAGIRASAPVLHGLTAMAIFAVTRIMYDGLTAFWAAIVYITLPAVGYSSLIISTDAVLLPFWAVALGLWWRGLQRPSDRLAVALGICIGLGLMAKYAMIYFVLSAAVHLAVSREARGKILRRFCLIAAAVATIIVIPNLCWNFEHGWATFSHTAENADWEGSRKGGFEPALEFIGGQFGMFGPILLGMVIWFLVSGRGKPKSERTVFLLCFSMPLLVIVLSQAFIAGSHTNWAAPAYIALTILLAHWAVTSAPRWLLTSTVLHLGLIIVFCFMFAGYVPARDIPHRIDILAKLRGWDRMAQLIDGELKQHPGHNLLLDERKFAVLFSYYLRNKPYQIVIWPFKGKNHSQFSMTNSIDLKTGREVLLVTRWPEPNIENMFPKHKEIGSLALIPSPGEKREFYLFDCRDLQLAP